MLRILAETLGDLLHFQVLLRTRQNRGGGILELSELSGAQVGKVGVFLHEIWDTQSRAGLL